MTCIHDFYASNTFHKDQIGTWGLRTHFCSKYPCSVGKAQQTESSELPVCVRAVGQAGSKAALMQTLGFVTHPKCVAPHIHSSQALVFQRSSVTLCGEVPRPETEQFFVICAENAGHFSKAFTTCSLIKHGRIKLILSVRFVVAFLKRLMNSMVSVTYSSSSVIP